VTDEEKGGEHMDNDFQAKMEFIVNHQAQFAANIQIHEERLTRLEGAVTKLESTVAGLAQVLNNTIEHFDARTARLEESQKRTEEALARLAESQAHTDRRLDALIDIIRQEREGRNGKA
jgi:t-SNARE complex subunit (syntaxin)